MAKLLYKIIEEVVGFFDGMIYFISAFDEFIYFVILSAIAIWGANG